MIPTHISETKKNNELIVNQHSHTQTIKSTLIDLFSQKVEIKNDTNNSKLGLQELYTNALDKIISYGEGDIIGPLKKSVSKGKDDDLSYQDISDITVSLEDIITAFGNISIKSKLPSEHNTAITKAFLYSMESVIQALPQVAQDIYKNEIIANSKYIYSLEYLGKGLQKFFDECKKAGYEITKENIDTIHATEITYTDIEHQLTKIGLITKTQVIDSHKQGNIPANSEQEKLLNTHMTLFGVSKIQSIFTANKSAEKRLHNAYDFGGIENLWEGLGINDELLVKYYPQLKLVIEDSTRFDYDKTLVRVSCVGKYLASQNNPLGSVLIKLSQSSMDFSLLSQNDLQIYTDALKDGWIQSNKGSDLIDYFDSFGVKRDQALRLIDGFFSPDKKKITIRSAHDDKINITIDKKIFTGKSLEENCHLLQTQGLPFSFTLTGDTLDENELRKIHTKKDGFYADKIPHALTLIVGAKAIAGMPDEELNAQSDEIQEKLNQHTFSPENLGLHTSLAAIDDFEDKIDWKAESTIQKLTQEELNDAKQLYTKHIAGLKRDIGKSQKQEINMENKLKLLHDKILQPKNATESQIKAWEKTASELEKSLSELAADSQEFQEEIELAEQKRKYIENLIKTKKNQTSINVSEKTGDVILPPKDLEKPKNYLKEAEEKWNSLQGDKNAPFAVGSSIYVDIPDVKGPLLGWKNPWARGEIISIDNEGNFEIKWTGVDEPLKGKNQDGHAIEGSVAMFYGASGIDDFLGKVGKMWKFGKKTSWKDFGMYLKDKGLDVDKEYKDYLGNFLSKVDFSSMYRKDGDKILTSDDNRIKYLGGSVDDLAAGEKPGDETIKTQKVWYELKQHDDGVTVTGKDRDGNPYSKKMNPQEFMVFVMDKGLQTYTQNEVDTINTDRAGKGLNSLQSEIDRSYDIPAKKKRLWTNLKSITHAFKFGIDGVKKWVKDKQGKDDKKLEKAMLGSKWFQSLKGLPLIGDAFEDMFIGLDKEEDQEKTKKIKEAMEEPEKNGEDTSDGPFDYILNVGKFKEVAEGGILTDADKVRKFAGYYLYVLSKKGPSPYPKSLSKYAGKGVWVRGLLGSDYQDKYFQHMNQLKDNVEKNPNDGESKKLLALGELGFMKKIYSDGNENLKKRFNGVFGKPFFAKTLGDYEPELYDQGAVEDVAKKAKNKLFNDAKSDYDKGFGQVKVLDMYGSLKGMGENIKSDPSNYRQWMMRLALPILSGVTVNYMDEGLRKDYTTLARQYASPFGIYAKDADGQRKLWELFGIISNHPDVGSNFLKEFAEFMPTATKNLPTEEQYAPFLKKLDTRWFNNGNKMLDLLAQPGKLIQIKADLEKKYETISVSSPEKQEVLNKILAIRHYIDKKVLDDEQGEIEVKLGGIVAEKHIMNLSPGAIRRLLTYSRGSFQKDLIEDGPKAWKALTKQVKSYNTKNGEKASKDLYQFVLKKFLVFFEDKGHFTSANLKQLLVALKYAHKPNVMNVYITDVIDPNDQAPKEVKDAIEAFQDFLKNNKPDSDDDMKSILNNVIDNTTGDKYVVAEPSGIQDNNKKYKTKMKTQVAVDIMKEKGTNLYMENGKKISILRDVNGRLRDESGYVLEKEGGGKGGQQNNKMITFNVIDPNSKSYVKTVQCGDYDEATLASYEELLSGGNNNGYYNQLDEYNGY